MSEQPPPNRSIPLVCTGHTRPIHSLRYSPITDDGYFIISGCLDGKPQLRNGATGDWIGTFEGHKGAVWGCSINALASQVATASADFSVKLWDAISGTELTTFAHKHIVKTVDFSVDNTQVISGGMEKKIRIYDLQNYNSEPMILQNESKIDICLGMTNQIIFSSNNEESGFKIWDGKSGECVGKVETPGVTPTSSMELSWCRQYLTIGTGTNIHIYSTASLTIVKSIELDWSIAGGAATLHPSLLHVAAGAEDFPIRQYDYATGTLESCHRGHFGAVRCMQYSPTGEAYASGSVDGTIRIWQTNSLMDDG